MANIQFDETVAGVIKSADNCIFKADGMVGSKEYKLCLYIGGSEKGKYKYYLLATEDDVLVCIKNIRDDLDKLTADKMIEDLNKRINTFVMSKDSAAEAVVVTTIDEEEADVLNQPVLVKITTNSDVLDIEKNQKAICYELNDWLDALNVVISSAISQKQVEDYQQEYAKIMSANLIPHDDHEVNKDYSSTMCTLTVIFALISIFFHAMCVFPVIAVISGIFSAYRCYTNKNKVAMVLCLLAVVVGCVFAYIGWKDLYASMVPKVK